MRNQISEGRFELVLRPLCAPALYPPCFGIESGSVRLGGTGGALDGTEWDSHLYLELVQSCSAWESMARESQLRVGLQIRTDVRVRQPRRPGPCGVQEKSGGRVGQNNVKTELQREKRCEQTLFGKNPRWTGASYVSKGLYQTTVHGHLRIGPTLRPHVGTVTSLRSEECEGNIFRRSSNIIKPYGSKYLLRGGLGWVGGSKYLLKRC